MQTPMLIFAIVVAGLLGLAIGSFLNVVVARVPSGVPLTRESRCPQCGAPVRWWQNIPIASWFALGGRCASCQRPISARYPLVEATTAAAFAGIAWWVLVVHAEPTWTATVLVLIAYLYLVAISIALTLIDLDTHRLPNAIVLPSYIVAIALLAFACVLGSDWFALARAAVGMAALYALYLLLRVIRPAGMGGGDVKLAGVLGLYLGWIGWGALAVGAFGAFLLGGVFGGLLLLMRRAGRRTAIPFGPWMILGAWVGLIFGEVIGHWYLGIAAGS